MSTDIDTPDETEVELDLAALEAELDAGETAEGETESEPEEIILQVGDDELAPESEESAPQWAKDLRKQNRELQAKLAEKERGDVTPQPTVADPGPRPKIADFDYDEEKFDAATDEWLTKRTQFDREKERLDKLAQDAEAKKQKLVEKFTAQKDRISRSYPDYDLVESRVTAKMSPIQQNAIVALSPYVDSAGIIYAAGKNPELLAELSKAEDPIEFIVKLVNKSQTIKAVARSKETAPPPVREISGTTSHSRASVDRLLDAAERKADRTGDRTEVIRLRQKYAKILRG